jgi:exo-beta-1,3-glucanase (GH17 family)
MSQANVNKDIARFKENGIINVRTYAQECDQLEQIVKAIAAAGGGMTVVAGVWIDGTF